MSEGESFLARWARLKREAATEPRRPQAKATTGEATPPVAEPELPPVSLPPLDSIDAASNLAAFLAPGVPAELTRAALRRAWIADPAIRDFIGLSENAWDFTAPDGVPGFGPLEADEVRRLLDGMLAEASPAATPPTAAGVVAETPSESGDDATCGLPEGEPTASIVWVQAEEAEKTATAAEVARPRRHGGALPQS